MRGLAARSVSFPVMIDGDDNEKNRQPILDDDDDVLTFKPGGEGLTEKERDRGKRGRAERGIFISIRFFLVILHNASLSSPLPTPPEPESGSGHARAYHYREGIIG